VVGVGGGTATVTLTRELTGPGVSCAQSTVPSRGFYGLYCSPTPGAVHRPPVLEFGGSDGGLSTGQAAELLASRGYPALALAYFAAPGLPRALDRIPLEYFARAARWLARQPGAGADGLTVWGISRGSEAALLLGAYFPGLVHAVIAGSPSSVNNGAVSLALFVPPRAPAWMLHGKPLPVAAPFGSPYSPGNPASVLPVQKIKGPVLPLVGADDELWPSRLYAQAIMARLDHYHDRYPRQDLVFPGAGHEVGAAFPYDLGPASFTTPVGTLDLGGTPFVTSVAETKAWHDVLAFLGRLRAIREVQSGHAGARPGKPAPQQAAGTRAHGHQERLAGLCVLEAPAGFPVGDCRRVALSSLLARLSRCRWMGAENACPLGLQNANGPPNRGPGHAKHRRKLPLRRQRLAGQQQAKSDLPAKLLGNIHMRPRLLNRRKPHR
jgi:dienelactone hydrolase